MFAQSAQFKIGCGVVGGLLVFTGVRIVRDFCSYLKHKIAGECKQISGNIIGKEISCMDMGLFMYNTITSIGSIGEYGCAQPLACSLEYFVEVEISGKVLKYPVSEIFYKKVPNEKIVPVVVFYQEKKEKGKIMIRNIMLVR